ncbi:helix-turn-helix domain-containing protein [Kordiimonas sp.]|uniref:helix-turn-helix domain-containing protein n=1 Tax=Kordiimonas sp. TaxID=1970157 RepID=UPI003B522AED
MDKLANIIGARIGAYRKARGLTQEDLAGLSARSVFTISQVERGVNAPNLATLIDLAQALECGLDELVFGRSTTDQTKKTKEHVNLEARLVADIVAMDLKTLKATRSAINAIFEAQS